MPALVTLQLSTLTLTQPVQSNAAPSPSPRALIVPRETEIVRSFHTMCLVPAADLCNHCLGGGYWAYSAARGALEFRAAAAVPAGQQVCLDYNAGLLTCIYNPYI